MRALIWQGKRSVSVEQVPDPTLQSSTDAIIKVGRPPPPVYSPERVAGIVVRAIDRPRDRIDAGFANPLTSWGFAALPKVYDALVGPLFRIGATDDELVPPHQGNVIDASAEGHQLHGEQGSAAVAIGRSLIRQASRLLPATGR